MLLVEISHNYANVPSGVPADLHQSKDTTICYLNYTKTVKIKQEAHVP